jgi:hypothetical protein
MSNFEIVTLDLREKQGFLAGFSRLRTAFSIAFPQTNRVLGKVRFSLNFFSGTLGGMNYTLLRLKLQAPLFYAEDRNLEPFHPPEDAGETLFCFEIDRAEGRSIEPGLSAFPGTLLFAGRAVADDAPPAEEKAKWTVLPGGSYLFVQTEGLLSREEFAKMAVEIQKDGLWERLEPENRIYLRYLFEDGRRVSQIFRPYKRAASTM